MNGSDGLLNTSCSLLCFFLLQAVALFAFLNFRGLMLTAIISFFAQNKNKDTIRTNNRTQTDREQQRCEQTEMSCFLFLSLRVTYFSFSFYSARLLCLARFFLLAFRSLVQFGHSKSSHSTMLFSPRNVLDLLLLSYERFHSFSTFRSIQLCCPFLLCLLCVVCVLCVCCVCCVRCVVQVSRPFEMFLTTTIKDALNVVAARRRDSFSDFPSHLAAWHYSQQLLERSGR
jgi:hypothetical protein